MADRNDEMVTFRLGPKDRAAIRKLVEDGEFRNRSDFLRYAVKAGLRDFMPQPPRGKLDLDLEAVELPAGEAAGRGRARPKRGVSH